MQTVLIKPNYIRQRGTKKIEALSRLLYLALQLRDRAPLIPRDLRKYIPQIDLILAARDGVDAASVETNVAYEQLKELYDEGGAMMEWETPTPHAMRLLVAQTVLNNLENESVPVSRRVEVMSLVGRFINDENTSMIEGRDIALNNIPPITAIPMYNTGFNPIDQVLQGCYQALMMIIALPGAGKTSHMLSMMGSLKDLYPNWPLKFIEQEIPANLFLHRMGPILKERVFSERDHLYTAKSMEEIIEIVMSDESNDQVVFIDSPDSMNGPGANAADGGRRFDLENMYRQFVTLKEKCRLIVVSSQPRRNDNVLTLKSAAESFAKVWYVDIMIGLWPIGELGRLRMRVLKNRFGVAGRTVDYNYDYANLTASHEIMLGDEWQDQYAKEEPDDDE